MSRYPDLNRGEEELFGLSVAPREPYQTNRYDEGGHHTGASV